MMQPKLQTSIHLFGLNSSFSQFSIYSFDAYRLATQPNASFLVRFVNPKEDIICDIPKSNTKKSNY